MKHSCVCASTALLAVFLALAGCRQTPPYGETDGTTDTSATAETLAYQGDFEGPLGLQLWSVRRAMRQDVPGTLQKVHDWGFREVELAGTYGMSARQFRQLLDSTGLNATSMHVSYELMRDSLDKVLNQAETLGVRYVGVPWLPHPEGQPLTVAEAHEIAANFNTWGRAARDRGLTFFYHTHGYEFVPDESGAVPFDVLMKETEPDLVTYQLDVFHVALPGQDPAALLRKYPDRWQLLHLKDLKKGVPTTDQSGAAPASEMVPVGSGQIDWPEVLRTAQEVGVKEYYVEDESDDPMNNIPASIHYMETVAY
ncbi:MAG TPA: sugar phosphate isomerase/epimerase [Rhodothermales bacterium]|nr:sugar phosphate isomerase/epimerase [Rhodothermales bacterium]